MINRKLKIFLLITATSGCANNPPTIASGLGQLDVVYYNGVNSSLTVTVIKIEAVPTGNIVFKQSDRAFLSSMSIDIPEGSYNISYSCNIDFSQGASSRFSGIATPIFTDKYTISAGESLRLSYQLHSNIKYGNYCTPVFYEPG